jgi:hypothetical protein
VQVTPAMTRAYAKGTSVSVERTKVELEKFLRQQGATATATYHDTGKNRATVLFALAGKRISVDVPLPTVDQIAVPKTKHGRPQAPAVRAERQKKALEQLSRERWRQIFLLVKAKLAAISVGGSTLEREFLADLLLGNGKTVGVTIQPQVARMIETGKASPLLLLPGS